jgi:hypothetical protein
MFMASLRRSQLKKIHYFHLHFPERSCCLPYIPSRISISSLLYHSFVLPFSYFSACLALSSIEMLVQRVSPIVPSCGWSMTKPLNRTTLGARKVATLWPRACARRTLRTSRSTMTKNTARCGWGHTLLPLLTSSPPARIFKT